MSHQRLGQTDADIIFTTNFVNNSGRYTRKAFAARSKVACHISGDWPLMEMLVRLSRVQ
jgi:hypothetical protein